MKTLIQSCLVFLVVTVSWFALHHWLFSHEVIAQKELVQKITERRCVDEELNRMARDSELHKFEEILARGQHYLEEKVPKTAEIGPLLASLSEIAQQVNVLLVGFEAHVGKVDNELRARPINLVMEGDYENIVHYLNRLSEFKRLLRLEDFSYEDRKARAQLWVYNMDLQLYAIRAEKGSFRCQKHAFNLIPVQIPWRAQEEKMTPLLIKRDPFIERQPRMSQHGVHLAGVIRQGAHWIALLEDDSGTGQVVHLGDKVPGGYLVQSIGDNKVVLSKGHKTKTLSWRKP